MGTIECQVREVMQNELLEKYSADKMLADKMYWYTTRKKGSEKNRKKNRSPNSFWATSCGYCFHH